MPRAPPLIRLDMCRRVLSLCVTVEETKQLEQVILTA